MVRAAWRYIDRCVRWRAQCRPIDRQGQDQAGVHHSEDWRERGGHGNNCLADIAVAARATASEPDIRWSDNKAISRTYESYAGRICDTGRSLV